MYLCISEIHQKMHSRPHTALKTSFEPEFLRGIRNDGSHGREAKGAFFLYGVSVSLDPVDLLCSSSVLSPN